MSLGNTQAHYLVCYWYVAHLTHISNCVHAGRVGLAYLQDTLGWPQLHRALCMEERWKMQAV